MEQNVKRVRGAKTRATQRKIVDAAADLFVTEGYHATTLEQIAVRAGVAVQTVYFHFGNKRSVLKRGRRRGRGRRRRNRRHARSTLVGGGPSRA